jgi:hypothetical protein
MRSEDHRAGQMDDLGAVPDQRVADATAGQAEPEARVTGQRHGRDAHHGVGEWAGISRVARRLRRDDERLVAAGGEEFRDSQHAVCDAADVGRERLGNDRNPLAHTVRYKEIAASQPP